MNTMNEFTPHELLELHELLSSEITSALKLQNAIPLAKDADVAALMTTSLSKKQQRIRAMQNLLNL